MKYTQGFDEFKKVLSENGIDGLWHESEKKIQLRTCEGGTIILFSNGTIQVQGKEEVKANLLEKIEEISSQSSPKMQEGKNTSVVKPSNHKSQKVFVVYGHDTVAREQLELILMKLGLDPFVLSNTSGGGNTIIEALEDEILSPDKNCECGIVLMTPDDMGYAIADGDKKIEPRTRQNVVLEMGMLLSALKRDRVVILKKGHLEVPSDTHGIIYLPFNNHVKETVPKLVQRLEAMGLELSRENITRASS